MRMPATIRTAAPADADEVYRLIHELAVYEKLDHEVKADPASVRRAMECDDPRVHVLLAEDERPVGFALYFFTYSTFEGAPTLYLEDLFVEPERRGEGLGTLLLRELARVASLRGCRRMEWTALDWNTDARTFYENLGARPMSTWIIHRLGVDGIEALSRARSAEGSH